MRLLRLSILLAALAFTPALALAWTPQIKATVLDYRPPPPPSSGGTAALDGTAGVTPDTTLPGPFTSTTFTIPLPVTTHPNDIVLVLAKGQVFTPASASSTATGAFSTIATNGTLRLFQAVASSIIGSGQTVTVTMPGANDNIAGVAFAVSGANTSSPTLAGFPITGTTTNLSFTVGNSSLAFAYIETSAGSTGHGTTNGWIAMPCSPCNGSPSNNTLEGNPGISNSPIFGDVLEYQIGPVTASATLNGGTPVVSIGDAITP
jgi:hypothetical protein